MKIESDPEVRKKQPRITLIGERLKAFALWCEKKEVTLIVAVGNDPQYEMHEVVPSGLATSQSNVIAVGGVDEQGKKWDGQTKVNQNHDSRVSVYAPAKDIMLPGLEGAGGSGSSQATAIVVSRNWMRGECQLLTVYQSGLAAYFLGHPKLLDHEDLAPGSRNLKKFIMENSWTRDPPGNQGPLDVPYNLARGLDEKEERGFCLYKRANGTETDDQGDMDCEDDQNSTGTVSASGSTGTSR